jgi:1,4-dihydroxy-2-naphthoate octaprenyltransferase
MLRAGQFYAIIVRSYTYNLSGNGSQLVCFFRFACALPVRAVIILSRYFMNLKVWFIETRPQFLILSLVLVFLGASIAMYDGYVNVGYAVLAAVGLVLCHASSNILNDYFDYTSGVDLKTKQTAFSGGSGLLPAMKLTSRQVMWFGVITLLLAVPIGIYFTVTRGLLLLPLLVIGAFCVVLYTPSITKWGWPEWAPGVGLGLLPVIGAYFIQIPEYTVPVLIASIPSGILVHNLLLLNEFPDVEADKTVKRKTLPITMGRRGAAIVYSSLTVLVYVWIVGWVIAGVMPVYSLLGLLTIPFAVKAIRGSFKSEDMSILGPALASNVMVVLLTQVLMGVGYILARVLA